MEKQLGADAIENGFIAIGWPEMGDLSNLPNDRASIKELLSQHYPDAKEATKRIYAGILLRFFHTIKVGDFVVYPSKHDRMVNIGKVIEQARYSPETSVNFPNQRKVDWVASFPRSDFSQEVLNEIGAYITIFSIQKHPNVFLTIVNKSLNAGMKSDESLELSAEDDSLDDDTVVENISRQTRETTSDFLIKRLSQKLNGYEFEDFIANILVCMGYTARVTAKSGDGGVDIIAHTDELGFVPPIIKVQCKKITGQTSEPEVSQLLGTLGEGEFALFVNLGSYSKPARQLERNRAKLRLIDGEQLVELVLENYDQIAARYRTLLPLTRIYVPDIT